MSDRPAAAPVDGPVVCPVDGPANGGGPPRGRLRAIWTTAGKLLASRPARWGFVAVAVGLGGYAVARQWTGVRAALASLRRVAVAPATLSALLALLSVMQGW